MCEQEVREIAERYGFTVEVDNQGQLVLYTGVTEVSQLPFRELVELQRQYWSEYARMSKRDQ